MQSQSIVVIERIDYVSKKLLLRLRQINHYEITGLVPGI